MKTLKDFLPEGWGSSALTENAEELNIGDDVIITGNVEFKGSTGVIADFGSNKSFVVVNLYNHGKRSFHSSDVSFNDYAGSDEEAADMYDNDEDFRDWQHENSDIDEGIVSDIKRGVKKFKRGVAGWGSVEDSPKELVARNKAHDDETLRRLNRAANTPLDFPFNGTPSKHSPAGLQKRVLGKEMKKRGLVGESAQYQSIDKSQAEWAKIVKGQFPNAKFYRAEEALGGTIDAYSDGKWVGDWDGGGDGPAGRMIANNVVDEAARKPLRTWEAFDANDYADENSFYQALSAAILDFVADKFGGQAWFKGGSYAYKVDASNPNVLTASDGSVVKVEGNLASTLEDYSDRYAFNDFVDCDSYYWDEYFRPVKDPNRLAKDGAPMHGSDQAEHEYNNMMGESVDDIKRLAGLK